MATLRDIRQRIVAVKSTAKITSAMKMVAAAKLRRAQSAIESARPYFSKLEEMVSGLVNDLGGVYSHQFIEKRAEIRHVTMIVISSDRGLCGSFNTNIFKFFTNFVTNEMPEEYKNAKITVIPVGRKSVAFFKKTKLDITVSKEFPGVFHGLNFQTAQDIVSTVSSDFVEGKTDEVLIFFNEFINLVKQHPGCTTLLPIKPSEKKAETKKTADYIFEPDKKEILDVLIPKLVDIKAWRSLLESAAAEEGARMMAMDTATTNARDLIIGLELQYNKARQSAITTEMLEIVSGAEALRSV